MGIGANGRSLSRLDDLDQTAIPVDDHPISGLNDVERIPIEVRHARHAHDDCPERDLRGHLVEHERLRCGAGKPRGVIHRRPPRRPFGAAEHQDFVPEALAAQFVLCFSDDALHGVDAAPAWNRLPRDQRLPFGATADCINAALTGRWSPERI